MYFFFLYSWDAPHSSVKQLISFDYICSAAVAGSWRGSLFLSCSQLDLQWCSSHTLSSNNFFAAQRFCKTCCMQSQVAFSLRYIALRFSQCIRSRSLGWGWGCSERQAYLFRFERRCRCILGILFRLLHIEPSTCQWLTGATGLEFPKVAEAQTQLFNQYSVFLLLFLFALMRSIICTRIVAF